MEGLASRAAMNISEAFLHYLKVNKIDNEILGIAVSGGIDSITLLEIAIRAYSKDKIYCLHLDHGLREDSHLARSFLENLCLEKEIKFISKAYRYGEILKDENSARKARYDFFVEAAQEHNIQHILLAHNLNDHVETIIFRLLRGTNTRGLKGIPVKRRLAQDLYIHRPLLGTSREEILEYLSEHNLNYIEDSSNLNLDYHRNLIRMKLLPEALKINPRVISNIEKLSQIISEEQSFLDKLVNLELKRLGDLPWDLAELKSLDRIIQRKILELRFTRKIKFVDRFLDSISAAGFHRINYAKGKYFTIKQKKIYLEEPSF